MSERDWNDWTRFPTDDLTLGLLAESCRLNPDTGRSHLDDFLHMGTRVATVEEGGVSYDTVDEALADSMQETPVLYVEYEPGFEPHSPHTVIISLIEEILRLRGIGDKDKTT